MPNKPITDEKLAAWRALREAATAGEWHGGYLGSGPNQPYTDPATLIFKVGTMIIDSIEAQGEERPFMSVLADKRTVAMTLHGPTNFANTDFIVAAGNNWLRLLDEITRLQAENNRLQTDLSDSSAQLVMDAGEIDRLREIISLATELIDWDRGLTIGRGYGEGWRVTVSQFKPGKFKSLDGKFYPTLDEVFAKIEEIESRPDVRELEEPE